MCSFDFLDSTEHSYARAKGKDYWTEIVMSDLNIIYERHDIKPRKYLYTSY